MLHDHCWESVLCDNTRRDYICDICRGSHMDNLWYCILKKPRGPQGLTVTWVPQPLDGPVREVHVCDISCWSLNINPWLLPSLLLCDVFKHQFIMGEGNSDYLLNKLTSRGQNLKLFVKRELQAFDGLSFIKFSFIDIHNMHKVFDIR